MASENTSTNGFGRKFWLSLIAEILLGLGLTYCLLTPELREMVKWFVGAIATVATGYGVNNMLQARAYAANGGAPAEDM